jgi:hypothetical protein
VRTTRNKNIRKDLITILKKEGPLTAAQLCSKLIEMKPNRMATPYQVSQILRVREFEKAEVLPTLTGVWKLKEE